MKGLILLKIKCTLCSLFNEQAPFLEQEEYCKCFQERRRSSQPFSSLPKRMPLCLQGTASHVTIENDGVLAPITGVQAKVWRHPCPAPFEEPHCWFSTWHGPVTHTGLAFSPPHTRCSPQTSRMGNKDSRAPGALVWHRQLPKRMLSPADTMQKTEQTKGCCLLEALCCSSGMVQLQSVSRRFIPSHLLSLLLVS